MVLWSSFYWRQFMCYKYRAVCGLAIAGVLHLWSSMEYGASFLQLRCMLRTEGDVSPAVMDGSPDRGLTVRRPWPWQPHPPINAHHPPRQIWGPTLWWNHPPRVPNRRFPHCRGADSEWCKYPSNLHGQCTAVMTSVVF